MSNEQFQMLMNLAENTSDGAFWLVIVFFSMKVIGWLIAAAVTLSLAHYIRSTLRRESYHESWIKDIYLEVTGNQVTYGEYASSDHRLLMSRIRMLKEVSHDE